MAILYRIFCRTSNRFGLLPNGAPQGRRLVALPRRRFPNMYGARWTMAKNASRGWGKNLRRVDRPECRIALAVPTTESRDVHGRVRWPVARKMIRRWRDHDNTVINICGRSIGCASICRNTCHPRHSLRRHAAAMKPLRKLSGRRQSARSCPWEVPGEGLGADRNPICEPVGPVPRLIIGSCRAFLSSLRISLKFT
jgi:hypothetical protein